MHYRLRYSEEAVKGLKTAPGFYRQRFRQAIEGLANNPRPAEARPMRDHDRYKIRFDNWRLLYSVDDEQGEIVILRIARKSGPETYLDLPVR